MRGEFLLMGTKRQRDDISEGGAIFINGRDSEMILMQEFPSSLVFLKAVFQKFFPYGEYD